ncbi:MAG: sensor histidine kinase [Anaerolineae bacterium]|nr:sensor histidine kinase [Anaerolineae bacterium]
MLVNELQGEIDIKSPMENRLLTIFRALAVIRLLLSILFLVLPGIPFASYPWTRYITVVEAVILLTYLSIPWLKTKLGRAYLPTAIAWATLMPLLVQTLTLYEMVEGLNVAVLTVSQLTMMENTLILGVINQSVLVLIVPLIVVGWAYSRSVLTLYCAGIFLFDVLMTTLFLNSHLTLFLLAFALIIFRTMLHAVIGVMINQIVSVQLEQQRRLIDANDKLREYALMREQWATSQERARLARELHDTLAHTLSAATVQLEAVSLIWEQQPQKAHQMVVKSTAMMREGLAETRRALHALRAGSLDHDNLVDAITMLAESLMTRFPIQVEVQTSAPLSLQNTAVEHGLYRIVQEALFNAARHAQAKKILIRIEPSARELVIAVSDDGVGFQVDAAHTNGHFGIRGMHERAQHIGAVLRILSHVGTGTTVTVTLKGNEASDANSDLR